MKNDNPEISQSIVASGIRTNYHDAGHDNPVMLIHGSGPGVSAWANWRLVLPRLAEHRRVIAPDLVGFGFTERPPGIRYDLNGWVSQAVGLLDSLGIEQADLVGNSFGGAVALALAIRHPRRVRRLVLMGSVGVSFPLTEGLDAVWGYTPSLANMRALLDIFAHDRRLVTDELARLRYEASMDLVVMNPPYIPSSSLEKTHARLLEHEPREAFDGGPYGISIVTRLLQDAPAFLKPGGHLLFEFGQGQEKLVQRLAERREAYAGIGFAADAQGAPRVGILRTRERP